MEADRMLSRSRAFSAIGGVLVALSLAAPARAQTQAGSQAGSPVSDILTKAKNALNDLKYREADSLASRVLSYGPLLSKNEQLEATQLRVAALFPEDAGDQKMDSVQVAIRQMFALGATAMPRDLSWAGLDTLIARALKANQPAKLVFGSRTPAAFIYVDGQPQGAVDKLRAVLVPPGVPVKITIRADKCAAWDSTVTVRAADSIRVGYRQLVCPP
jgi:hypothetical protein